MNKRKVGENKKCLVIMKEENQGDCVEKKYCSLEKTKVLTNILFPAA